MSSLGDILHSMVIAKPLKEAGYRVTWAVERRFKSVLSVFPDVDEVIAIDLKETSFSLKSFLEARAFLKKEVYDAVIDVQGLMKSALVTFFARSKVKIGFAFSNARELSYLFYGRRVEVSHLPNILDKNLELLSALNISIPPIPSYHIRINEAYRAKVEGFFYFADFGSKKVLVNPWAGFYTKELPEAVLFDLLKELKRKGVNPVLMYGPDEKERAKRVAEKAAVRLQPETSFEELFALIDYFDEYVGCDSGPSFIASMLGKKTLLLFGPTNALRQAPVAPRVKILYSDYECPIVKKEPVLTPYRCLKKECKDPLCMKRYEGRKIAESLLNWDEKEYN